MVKHTLNIAMMPHELFCAFCHIPGAVLLETQKASSGGGYSFIAWEPEKVFESDIRKERRKSFFDFIDCCSKEYFLAGYIGLLVHAIGANTFIIVRIMEPFWFFAGIIAVLPMLEQQDEAQPRETDVPETTSLSKFKRLGQLYPRL